MLIMTQIPRNEESFSSLSRMFRSDVHLNYVITSHCVIAVGHTGVCTGKGKDNVPWEHLKEVLQQHTKLSLSNGCGIPVIHVITGKWNSAMCLSLPSWSRETERWKTGDATTKLSNQSAHDCHSTDSNTTQKPTRNYVTMVEWNPVALVPLLVDIQVPDVQLLSLLSQQKHVVRLQHITMCTTCSSLMHKEAETHMDKEFHCEGAHQFVKLWASES